MSQLGLGVMIGYLGGNKETVDTVQSALGKTISSVELKEENLVFKFSDGSGIYLFDDGQSCCEHRYMRTDDVLSEYIGHKLVKMEIKDAPSVEDEYGEMHEVQFLDVTTDKGFFQMASHNEHNGYYGGFLIVAKPLISE